MTARRLHHRKNPKLHSPKINDEHQQLLKKPTSKKTTFKKSSIPPSLNDSVSHQPILRYHGSNFFRQRIILSTIFNRPIQISDIRIDDLNPGLKKYEASLLRLIDRITDGGEIHIDVTGTVLKYQPGQIIGGNEIIHDCGLERNITYFLEALLLIAPFGKSPLNINLRGITHGLSLDPSIDYFRTVALPFMSHIGIKEGVSLTVLKRGLPPLGQGEIEFKCPIIKKICPFQLLEEGRVKRVRGTAFANHVSPQFPVRMIDKARGMLNDFLPDVWIYDAKSRSGLEGPSPGYGITLVAETMKGFHKGADLIVDNEMQKKLSHLRERGEEVNLLDSMLNRKQGISEILKKEEIRKDRIENRTSEEVVKDIDSNIVSKFSESELIGRLAAQRLLLEIHFGGVIDTAFQYLPLLFMVLAEEHEPCKIKLSKLTPYSVQLLRHLKDFAGVSFSFEQVEDPIESDKEKNSDDEDSECEDGNKSSSRRVKSISKVIVKCAGLGFKNIGKKTF